MGEFPGGGWVQGAFVESVVLALRGVLSSALNRKTDLYKVHTGNTSAPLTPTSIIQPERPT